MPHLTCRMLAVAACLAGVSCSDNAAPKVPAGGADASAIDLNAPVGDPAGPATGPTAVDDPKPLDGLWVGSWGGGERDGVVFQPAIAEMFVEGDHVELAGFRAAGSLTGTVRFDVSAKQMQIKPTNGPADQPAPKDIEFVLELKGDELTLIDADKVSITFQRRRMAQNPLANAQLEFVAATGLNEAGDLLVTEFNAIEVGRAGATYFEPQNRSLKTQRATVLQVQETGLKVVSMDEARALVRQSMPVAIAYRRDDDPAPNSSHLLWRELGSPAPDGAAVGQTYSRMLRPGTLIFILSARENIPLP